MQNVKTVGLIAKANVEASEKWVPKIVTWLRRRGFQLRMDSVTAGYLHEPGGLPTSEVAEGCELVMSLGGDGTLLATTRVVHHRDVLIFPVNLGRLGFLSAIPPDQVMEELDCVMRGEFRESRRRLLRAELWRGTQQVSHYDALNDVVVTNSSLARMVEFDLRVDDSHMCGYKADGVIISTPTGSTAYSLSAGGPIIYPTVECFCLTPICPHILTNRPVVVPDSSTLELTLNSRNDSVWLTIDGQVGQMLEVGDRIVCGLSPKTVRLVAPPQMHFFDVLRDKLKWGEG
ncbi:MAG: NAD(+)/NADH kinase [Bryobacterales bacterium]|jgi:NAD+ kinase|nr:NAD(+)/NADH kinase [Bryobacterales bacterium]